MAKRAVHMILGGVAVIGLGSLVSCAPQIRQIQTATQPATRPATTQPATATAPIASTPPTTTQATKPQPVRVAIETTKGTIVVELRADKAPITVANFLRYVDDGFYNGVIFHRVIPRFMIQGGGFSAAMQRKPTRSPIINEAANGLKNRRGAIAMARTSDPHSAAAQFFINVADNGGLNYRSREKPGYTVFGRVVAGMDVVDAIVSVPTTSIGAFQNVPVDPIIIKAARRVAE